MNLISPEYLLFVAVTAILYYAVTKKYRYTVLLASSIAFYAYSAKKLIAVFLLLTLAAYICTYFLNKINVSVKSAKSSMEKADFKQYKQHRQKAKRRITVLFAVAVLLLLAAFKYYNFFAETFNGIVAVFGGTAELSMISLIVPLGISYYTLTAIGYVTDVYRGAAEHCSNYAKLLLFLMFFPQVTQGPFVRMSETGSALFDGNEFNSGKVKNGIILIMWGAFKKLVIADRIGIFVNEVFANSEIYGGLTYIAAIVGYTVQIYADFSGCTDIVRGTGAIYGVTLPVNFRTPFFSKSVDEFWRRWHITLGAFLRDYIFYPISLSKRFAAMTKKLKTKLGDYYGVTLPVLLSLFLVWFSNGIWHGASVKYIVYGLYYYAVMTLGKLTAPLFKFSEKTQDSKLMAFLRTVRTAALVCVGMLIFRAESLSHAVTVFKGIFTKFTVSASVLTSPMTASGLTVKDFFVCVAAVTLMAAVSIFNYRGKSVRVTVAKMPTAVRWCGYIAFALLILLFGIYGIGYDAQSFIYGEF